MDNFMKKFASKDKNLYNFTKIGSEKLSIYGGCYYVPPDHMNEFIKNYKKMVLVDQREAYFTEKQLKEGPLLIDLDFRYSSIVDERCHSTTHIVSLVQALYQMVSTMKQMTNDPITCYVFEKPHVNTSCEDLTKDGIHVVMDVRMDLIEKIIFREKLMKQAPEIFHDLPLTNTWDQVVDEGVMKGSVNWQLYGSRKPGNESYQLTYVFKGHYNQGWTLEQVDFDQDFIWNNFKCFTARNEDLVVLNTNIQEEYDRTKILREQVSRPKSMTLISDYRKPYDIKDEATLDQAVKELIRSTSIDEQYVKDTHAYTLLLDDSYYGEGSYNKWIKVGMALKNTSDKLFVTWVKFSSKSVNFEYDSIPDLYNRWTSFQRDERLSYRSIIYWCKEGNYNDYLKVFNDSIQKYIHYSFHHITDYDVANVLYQLYKESFVCVNIKNNLWYEFDSNRWIENDSGTTLRTKLSTEMYNLYFQFVRLLPASDDTEEKKEIASKFAKISLKLKTTNDKNNIMKESKEIFYDSAFYKLLDSKPYLIGCKNGVVDIQHRLFRKGIHSDYIHNTTNNDYYPLEHYKETKPNVITEIDEFMYQLFPETELREYMWEHLASTIIGTNQNQTFNIYLGLGANGKSKLVELMGKVLGDYKGTVPSTLITQKRTSIGGTSSEVHQLIGKRYAVMQELSKGDTINEGIMKEITGGDPIQCRALFKDSVTFIPQFKLVVCTNTLFDVKSNDDGTWRRIRVCEFKSKFTENPYKDKLFPKEQYPYQFKIDTKLDDKFKEWVPVFFSMLVDVAFVTQGKVKDRPCVLDPTNKYREGQDILLYFCQSNIVEEPSDSGNLKIGIVNDVFKQWITNEYGKNSSISNKELREYMEKKYGKYPKLGWSNLHIVEEEC